MDIFPQNVVGEVSASSDRRPSLTNTAHMLDMVNLKCSRGLTRLRNLGLVQATSAAKIDFLKKLVCKNIKPCILDKAGSLDSWQALNAEAENPKP